jgi:hypothetical protein
MDKRIQQGLDWLNKEMKKDSEEVKSHKKKVIDEIKKIDKKKIFEPIPKKKISILEKILIIFGYGKKR